MLVLAIDSAAAACAVCVWQDGKVLAQAGETMERGQDRRLIPLILAIMQQAGADFGTLDRIAVTRGPGSFTGLRIGLAAARGIGLAAQKPVIGIDRFALYRQQAVAVKNLLVVIQSRRVELFCRHYPADGTAGDAMMLAPEAIKAFCQNHNITIVTGDVPGLPGFLPPVEAESITCAALVAAADPADPVYLPRPLYIRPPDVSFPKTVSA